MTIAPTESVDYETVSKLVDLVGPLGTGYKFIDFLYTFGKTNRVDAALARIQRELHELRSALEQLQTRVNSLVIEDAKIKNLARTRTLHAIAKDLAAGAFKLDANLSDPIQASEVAFAAGLHADTFLTDLDLWSWSDIRWVTPLDDDGNPSGPATAQPVEADFKVAAALPVYAQALTVAIAGILIHTGGNKTEVRAKYGAWLDKHIAHVSLTYRWKDNGPGTPADTLAEKVRARIWCTPVAVNKYADDQGMCAFSIQCTDEIQRTRRVVREFTTRVGDPGGTTLCTIHPDAGVMDERRVEDEDETVRALALWEEVLRSVRATGDLPKEPFIGTFPSWTTAVSCLYGIDENVDLHYWRQTIGPPDSDATWKHGLRIGNGWDLPAFVSGGLGVVFGRRPDGTWRWFRHTGGEANEPSASWASSTEAGVWPGLPGGAADYQFLGMGDGVLYAVVDRVESGDAVEGDLWWTRHQGYLSGAGGFAPVRKVGWGWQSVTRLTCVGKGAFYGVRADGELRWLKHRGYLEGTFDWAQDRIIDTDVDWRRFDRIIGAEGGLLHAVLPDGRMETYRHYGWETGEHRLQGPFQAGDGWQRQRVLFAQQPGYVPGSGPH